jgi:predicted amidophosphoribosyltransferase
MHPMHMPIFMIIFVIALIFLFVATSQTRRRSNAPSRQCQSCGSSHPPFAQFCPRCGKRV